jgi:hypothetical protein
MDESWQQDSVLAQAVAAALLGLWVAMPLVPSTKSVSGATIASLSDTDMMSYVFATYQLEETL